ncbi:DedA family protein [Nocardia bovistercoris]|uniref:DedA family protein n=1 Tax=Nocardia bovistercoris TaxID=2785916 RepID=A0A931IDX3_9NOCA|nr:DedA family protein [Nocardia bovistercoris]MBH0779664.1 DedA family protein [Nocardia bovistercoris]
MGDITEILDGIHGPLLYLAFALIAAALFWFPIGMLFPGEPLVILAGSLAADGEISLPGVFVLMVAAGTAGMSLAYVTGRRFDGWISRRPRSRLRRVLDRGENILRPRGASAIISVSWIPPLRATLPVLAGATRYPFRRFLAFNVAGATVWIAVFMGGGYVAGPLLLGHPLPIIASIIVVLLVITATKWIRRRRADKVGAPTGAQLSVGAEQVQQ